MYETEPITPSSDGPAQHRSAFAHKLTGTKAETRGWQAIILVLLSVALFVASQFLHHMKAYLLSRVVVGFGFFAFTVALIEFILLLLFLDKRGQFAATRLGEEGHLGEELGACRRTARILFLTFIPFGVGFYWARKYAREQQQLQQIRSNELVVRLRCLRADLMHHQEFLIKSADQKIVLNNGDNEKETRTAIRINAEVFLREQVQGGGVLGRRLTKKITNHLKEKDVDPEVAHEVANSLRQAMAMEYAVEKVDTAIAACEKAREENKIAAACEDWQACKTAREDTEIAAANLGDNQHVKIGKGTVDQLLKMLRSSYGDVTRRNSSRVFVLFCYDGLSSLYSFFVPWVSLGLYVAYVWLMVIEGLEQRGPQCTLHGSTPDKSSPAFSLMEGVSPWEVRLSIKTISCTFGLYHIMRFLTKGIGTSLRSYVPLALPYYVVARA
jgi:hypothetical protein